MDCRNFKDLLDSYLCEELAVETNHQILGHAEHCPPCRAEMASRRQLRQSLQRACSKEEMSEVACERLRQLLRAEAQTSGNDGLSRTASDWRKRWSSFFSLRVMIPATVAAALLISIAGYTAFLKKPGPPAPGNNPDKLIARSSLSEILMTEAADDHRKCAPHFIPEVGPSEMPDSVREFDSAYVGLAAVAAEGAEGLQLHSAHVCRSGERRFAHLVYTRGSQAISLLVTKRDARALTDEKQLFQEKNFTTEDITELQAALRDGLALGAFQTAKHVVVVVSGLPQAQNDELAITLATPVIKHLRRIDNQSATLLREINSQNLIASMGGGSLR